MTDIEKRLEAFVRTGHGIIVFPGGVGTAEEILYILGILLHPDNNNIPFPLIFTGPENAVDYFSEIDRFIASTLGKEAQSLYEIIVNDPVSVARKMRAGIDAVRDFRRINDDAYYFNWMLTIDAPFQEPFIPNHDNMRDLQLDSRLDPHHLAANLRRVFSGIVAGNVKDEGIRAIEQHGLFEINGDQEMMELMDELLSSFVKQHRMKLPGKEYKPCYKIVK